VAAWQPGESSVASYQGAHGQLFHGDASGKIDQAERELMEAHEAMEKIARGIEQRQSLLARPLER